MSVQVGHDHSSAPAVGVGGCFSGTRLTVATGLGLTVSGTIPVGAGSLRLRVCDASDPADPVDRIAELAIRVGGGSMICISGDDSRSCSAGVTL